MHLRLSGWLRLLIVLSVAWFAFAAAASAWDGLHAKLFAWLNSFEPTAEDPLGILPKLIWSRFLGLLLLPPIALWVFAGATAWVVSGFTGGIASPLILPTRLQDVLALIQVLALDEFTHRSEDGLQKELQGPPKSAESWVRIAKDHPEFFRAHGTATHGVSLLARHATPKEEAGSREVTAEFTGKLLSLAVELHDRQLRRARTWEVFIPVVVAVVAAVTGLLGIALQ